MWKLTCYIESEEEVRSNRRGLRLSGHLRHRQGHQPLIILFSYIESIELGLRILISNSSTVPRNSLGQAISNSGGGGLVGPPKAVPGL